MEKSNKSEIKKNVATGTSTALGATVGVVIGTAISPQNAMAQEIPEHEPIPVNNPQPSKPNPPTPEPTPEPHPEPVPEPVVVSTPEPEINVIGYDRIITDNGNQMDVAVLDIEGHHVEIVDANLDGIADVIVCDVNENGAIEEDEIQSVQGENIPMQPLQDATGFSPEYAQNPLPDYVNDADVNSYMA